MQTHFSGFWALGLCVLALYLAPCQMQHATASLPQQRDTNTPAAAPVRNGSYVRVNRYALPATPAPNCEYKEMMTNLHDRVSVLATLDEDQRNRLEDINKKIVQFEESNLARLDSLGVQQMDQLKRLDSIDLIQRMTKREVEELKGELVELLKQQQNNKQKRITRSNNDMSLLRATRQTDVRRESQAQQSNNISLDSTQKLDALFTLLVSTRSAVSALDNQLQANLTKLLQQTGNIQKRFTTLIRRQQQQQHQAGGALLGQSYLPPQPNFYATANPTQQLITSCAQGAPTANGILKLQLTATSEPFYVACDERLFNGGWTVILNRYNGDVNFQRDWLEYKSGFGNLAGEFFIGLEKLHALTASTVHELLILLEDFEGTQRYARYGLFAIGNEQEFYAMKLLGTYSGNAGDALTYHAGSKFSTFDQDNDGCPDCNCAQAHMGAWWYNHCEMSNLNGKYFETGYNNTPTYQGVYWHQFRGPSYSLKAVSMMIRPVAADAENRRR